MIDTQAIIRAIDSYIKSQNKKSVTAPEANDWLNKRGLLNDSDLRPGLPLRKLLRANKLPHAYKVGRYWYIPISADTL